MSYKITLIGAGSAQFGMGMVGDIFLTPALEGSHITLLDINKEAVDYVHQKTMEHIEAKNLNFTVEATLDRKSALKDADFVIISIEVGDRFALWDMDWRLPHQYGIQQVYGENGGAGGLFHALRITPPILDICEDISQICPNAWIFNYSNPMSRICTTVKRKYPELNFVGMCHEISSLERYLPKILNTSFDNLDVKAAGLNHFSVLLEATYKDSGKDAYGDIRRLAPSYFEQAIGYSDLWEYYLKTGNMEDTEKYFYEMKLPIEKPSRPWSDRGLFKEILENFGYLPITVDSHMGEYIGWAHDKVDHKGILDFYDFYRKALGTMAPKIHDNHRHERCVFIMEALVGGAPAYVESAVNICNDGNIRNLPDWLVVEVPAQISPNKMEAVKVDMPASFGGLLSNQIGIHDLNAEAILKQSKDAVVEALLVDPVTINNKNIPDLVDVMIERQSPWLDYLKPARRA